MPAAFNNDVTLTVEIGFDSDPTVAIGSTIWTDVTADVRQNPGIQTERGRQHELDRFESGTMSLVLDDRDRDYDPFNTAGPHFGQLLPHRRIRVTATHDLIAYPVFNGFVESFKPGLDLGGDQISSLTCYDGLKVLARSDLTNEDAYSDLILADTPTGYYRLGDQPGSTTPIDSSGNGRNGSTSGVVFFGQQGGLQADPDTAVSLAPPDAQLTAGVETDGVSVATGHLSLPGSAIPAGSGGRTFEFWVFLRSTLPGFGGNFVYQLAESPANDRGFHVRSLLADEATGTFELDVNIFDGLGSFGFNLAVVTFNAWHHVVATHGGTGSLNVWKWYVDGVLERDQTMRAIGDGFANNHFGFDAAFGVQDLNGVIDEVAFYAGELSAADVLERFETGRPFLAQRTDERIGLVLDIIQWPTADRDLDVGDSNVRRLLSDTVTDVNALTHARLVEDTEAGSLYVTPDGQMRFRHRRAFTTEPVHLVPQATFDNFGVVGTLPYRVLEPSLDDVLIRNTVSVTPGDGPPQIVLDAASRAAFYVQGFQRSTELTSSATEEARQHAQFILNDFKDPKARIDVIVIEPQAQPNDLWPEILSRQLEDRVRVIFRPATGSNIDQELLVQRITHEIAGRTWRTTYQLGQVGAQGTFWLLGIVGRSELGETTVLGF